MSRSSANTNNDPSHHKQFQEAIKKWEEVRNDPAHNDPTEVLCEFADILEKVSRFTDHTVQSLCKILLPNFLNMATFENFVLSADLRDISITRRKIDI